jgi:hypothetical protein
MSSSTLKNELRRFFGIQYDRDVRHDGGKLDFCDSILAGWAGPEAAGAPCRFWPAIAIRAAEQNLIAANAEIGVARAAHFPQVSLSGFVGGQSTQFSSLFAGPHSAWSLVPQLSQPFIHGGKAEIKRQAYRG